MRRRFLFKIDFKTMLAKGLMCFIGQMGVLEQVLCIICGGVLRCQLSRPKPPSPPPLPDSHHPLSSYRLCYYPSPGVFSSLWNTSLQMLNTSAKLFWNACNRLSFHTEHKYMGVRLDLETWMIDRGAKHVFRCRIQRFLSWNEFCSRWRRGGMEGSEVGLSGNSSTGSGLCVT